MLLVTYYTTAPAERLQVLYTLLESTPGGRARGTGQQGLPQDPQMHKEWGHALPAEGGVYTGEVFTGEVVWCSW